MQAGALRTVPHWLSGGSHTEVSRHFPGYRPLYLEREILRRECAEEAMLGLNLFLGLLLLLVGMAVVHGGPDDRRDHEDWMLWLIGAFLVLLGLALIQHVLHWWSVMASNG
jgi:hypothetical protein